MLAAVAGEADAVELVEGALEAARRTLALVLFVVGLVAHARRESDPRRVGRPDDRLDAFLQVGQLPGLAALRGDHVEVRGGLLVAAAVRGEGEPRAVEIGRASCRERG